jgi:RNA polymerase sigma-70 factor (ECF subfamily)
MTSSKNSPSEGTEREGPPADELHLVARAQTGDTAAFNELVTRYRQRAFSMIYNMVRNEQDAWDLAQDGFLKAWKNIGRFRGQSSFYTWLYRILMNVGIDWLRKKQIDGLEYSEIADQMECSIGTVMSRLFYARKKLQVMLKDVYENI